MYHRTPSPSYTWQMPVMGWYLLLALSLHGVLLLNDFGTITEKAKLTVPNPLQLSFYQTPSIIAEDGNTQPPQPAREETHHALTTTESTSTPVKAVAPSASPVPRAPQITDVLPSTTTLTKAKAIAPPPPSAALSTESKPQSLLAEAETEEAAFDVASASSVVNTHLIQMIKSEFNYPILAKRRGWEGKVVLGFNLSSNGIINNIEILRSSGHSLLDRNASKTLSRIGMINPVTLEQLNWMGTHHLELPVIYQLNKG